MVNKVINVFIISCIINNSLLSSSTQPYNIPKVTQALRSNNQTVSDSDSDSELLNLHKPNASRASYSPEPTDRTPVTFLIPNTARPTPNTSINNSSAILEETEDGEHDVLFDTNNILGTKKNSFTIHRRESQASQSDSDMQQSGSISRPHSKNTSRHSSFFCQSNSKASYEAAQKQKADNFLKHHRMSLCPKDLEFDIPYTEHEEISCLSSTCLSMNKNFSEQPQQKQQQSSTFSTPVITGTGLLATGAATLAWFMSKNGNNPESMSSEELSSFIQSRGSDQKRFVDPAATMGLGFKLASGVATAIGVGFVYMKVKSFFISEIEGRLEQEIRNRKSIELQLEAMQQDVQSVVVAANKHSKNLNENNDRFKHIRGRTEKLLEDLQQVNLAVDSLQEQTEEMFKKQISTFNSIESAFENRDKIIIKLYESKAKKIRDVDLTCLETIPGLDEAMKAFDGFIIDHAVVREFSDSLSKSRISGSRPSVHQDIIPTQPKEKTSCCCCQ